MDPDTESAGAQGMINICQQVSCQIKVLNTKCSPILHLLEEERMPIGISVKRFKNEKYFSTYFALLLFVIYL